MKSQEGRPIRATRIAMLPSSVTVCSSKGSPPRSSRRNPGSGVTIFALAGGQAPGDYFLLRRALELRESGPRAIVVEYFPRLMSRDPDFNVENWPFVATPAECLEMARRLEPRPRPLRRARLLRELLPSIRCRNSIRANVLAALDGSFPTFASEIFSARRNWEVNRGAEIVASRPDRVEDVETWMRGYFPNFECTRVNRAYIKKLLELATRNEIPVFWVLPPYKPELQARCEQSGFDSDHEAFVKGLQGRYPGLYVIDGRRAGYDPRVFSDLHHLGRDGAAIFSARGRRVLRHHRDDPAATPRWLKLADYRPLASTPPLESMDESRRKIHEIVIVHDLAPSKLPTMSPLTLRLGRPLPKTFFDGTGMVAICGWANATSLSYTIVAAAGDLFGHSLRRRASGVRIECASMTIRGPTEASRR